MWQIQSPEKVTRACLMFIERVPHLLRVCSKNLRTHKAGDRVQCRPRMGHISGATASPVTTLRKRAIATSLIEIDCGLHLCESRVMRDSLYRLLKNCVRDSMSRTAGLSTGKDTRSRIECTGRQVRTVYIPVQYNKDAIGWHDHSRQQCGCLSGVSRYASSVKDGKDL
jgi:hypothetical protein